MQDERRVLELFSDIEFELEEQTKLLRSINLAINIIGLVVIGSVILGACNTFGSFM